MAGGSTNPLRQQMINMMYLVLTALLALNVSADILKAFAIVNQGLGKTNTSYKDKNDALMANFTKLYEQDKVKAQEQYTKAQKAKSMADQMFNYLQGIKEHIAMKAGGWKEGTDKATVEVDQDRETGTHYFLKEKVNGVEGKHGQNLRDSLIWFEKSMRGLLDDPKTSEVKFHIDTNDPPKDKDGTKKDWAEYYFEMIPAVAVVTELTKYQNDVRNAEAEVTNYLYKRVNAYDVKFTNVEPVVNLMTPSVLQGQSVKAEVVLAAYNNTDKPKVEVNGGLLPTEAGKALFETRASGMGEQHIKGVAYVKDPKTGGDLAMPFDVPYQVYTGSATISADKMNMLYIGLDNPVSVSVPGFRPDQVVVTATGGINLRPNTNTAQGGGAGHFFAKPDGSVRQGSVNVSVKMSDGHVQAMGKMDYRIRKVPNPEVLLGTKAGGAISRGELMTVSQVNAGFGESFGFEGLNITVTGYQYVQSPKNGGQPFFQTVTGNKITPDVRQHMTNAKPGDLIVITNVMANGPWPGSKQLNGPALTVR